MKRTVTVNDNPMVIIAVYYEPIHAHLAKSKLEAEGIETVLHDENIVSIQPFYSNLAGGIKLLVNKRYAKQACEILEEHDKYFTKASPHCPECNSGDHTEIQISNFIWVTTAILAIWLIWNPLLAGTSLFTLWLVLMPARNKYKCNACGNTW